MSRRHNAHSHARRARLIAIAVLALMLQLLIGWSPSAGAAVAPTGIGVAATTDNAGLGGAVPTVLVAVDAQFALTVTLAPTGATFTKDTVLSLTPTLVATVGGSPHGSFNPSSIVMPAGVNQQAFPVGYTSVDNGVVLNAAVAVPKGKTSGVLPGATNSFDVLKTVLPLSQGNPNFASGVGVGNSDCTSATTESECGIVVLPNDIQSSNAALSLGKCTNDLGCTSGSQVVQFIADLGIRYTQQAPATLIVRCSKTLCRNTNNGVQGFTLKVSFSATGPLNLQSKPCLSKGVALDADGNSFCTDYVQSHRDNAGAVLLFLLFTQDMRGST